MTLQSYGRSRPERTETDTGTRTGTGRDRDAERTYDLEPLVEALDDEVCRAVLRELDEPRTALELTDALSVPSSTMYRKLSLLSDAGLVAEAVRLRADGRHETEYVVGFDSIEIECDEDGELAATVRARTGSADARLAHLWQEVRSES